MTMKGVKMMPLDPEATAPESRDLRGRSLHLHDAEWNVQHFC